MIDKKIVVYTTGGFCDVMACSALFTNGDLGDNCNLIFIINTVDKNASFQEKTIKNIKRLTSCVNVSIETVYDYCKNDDIKSLDSELLKSNLTNIDKVYLYAESSGLRIDAFYRAFRDAEFIVYEEGMLGYCADIFHNSELGGLNLISKYYSTNYFEKISPQSLRQVQFEVCDYDKDAIKRAFSTIDDVFTIPLKPPENVSIMFVSAPLWRMGPLSYFDVLVEHLNVILSIVSTGATVYFKDHPRPEAKLFAHIHSLLDDDVKDLFIDVSDVAMLAETIVDVLNPDAVVGFGSTVLFNAPQFYDIPAFRTSTEFVAYSLGARRQHVLNCALKCQYLPHINELLDVLHSNCESKKGKIKNTFNKHIEHSQESLSNEVINNIYDGLFVRNVPVKNNLKELRGILYQGKVPSNKMSYLGRIYKLKFLKRLKVKIESAFKIKIIREETYNDLKTKVNSNNKTIEYLTNVIRKGV